MLPSTKLRSFYEVQAQRRFAARRRELPASYTREQVYRDLDRIVRQREARYDRPLGAEATATDCALLCGVQAERKVLDAYRSKLDKRAAAQAVPA